MPTTTSGDGTSAGRLVLAAGAVLWRPRGRAVEVALAHRPRYDDWSLPKGKLDAGETEPVAAVREVHEETGFTCRLGRGLGTVTYPIPEGTKLVRYWAAKALGGEFAANSEVDELVWLSVEDAAAKITYEHDRDVLRRFAAQPADTRTVLVVRHAKAGNKQEYRGDDRKRPLDKYGRAQAESLVALLSGFGADTLFAADRERCVQTLEPLADELGGPIGREPLLTEEDYWVDPDAARARMCEIAAGDGIPVVCTQGKVIPDLIEWWCDRDGVTPDESGSRKGSTWVLSLHQGRLVAADYLDSALPPGN